MFKVESISNVGCQIDWDKSYLERADLNILVRDTNFTKLDCYITDATSFAGVDACLDEVWDIMRTKELDQNGKRQNKIFFKDFHNYFMFTYDVNTSPMLTGRRSMKFTSLMSTDFFLL